MGFVKSFRNFLGFEEEIMEERSVPTATIKKTPVMRAQQTQEKVIAPDFQALRKSVKKSAEATNSSSIVIVEPRSYEMDSRQISEYLKDGHIVILNLKYPDAQTAKRLIDFVCGTTYAFDGFVRKLGGNIFLCYPGNVDVVDMQQEDPGFAEEMYNKYYTSPEQVLQEKMQFQEAG